MNPGVDHKFLRTLELKLESGIQFVLIFDIHLNDFEKFNLGFLLMLCQKDLQEDGWGGEGGMAGNIGGELGSIPTYPTFIPTGPKKLFCPKITY